MRAVTKISVVQFFGIYKVRVKGGKRGWVKGGKRVKG